MAISIIEKQYTLDPTQVGGGGGEGRKLDVFLPYSYIKAGRKGGGWNSSQMGYYNTALQVN